MKKMLGVILFAALILILSSSALAGTISIKEGESHLNYRAESSYKVKAIGQIEAGKDYEVVGEVLSWVKVSVDDIKRSKIDGWIGVKVLIKTNGKTIIGGDGCTMRTKPKTILSTANGYVWPGSVVTKQIDKVVNFYKIIVEDKEVYVSASYCNFKK